MKRLLLLILLFLFCGCDVTYNLKVDDTFKESISVIEANSDNWNYKFSGMSMIDYNNYYLQKEIPYHYDDFYNPEDFVKFDGVSYYDVQDLSSSSQVGLNLKSNFKSLDDYSRSFILNNNMKNINVFDTKDGIRLYGSGFKVFNQYKNLDSITVNLSSKYRVISNNADEVNNNVYSWNITRENYNDKNIQISYDYGILDSSDNPMILFVISLVVICFIVILIYLFLRIIFLKKNSL